MAEDTPKKPAEDTPKKTVEYQWPFEGGARPIITSPFGQRRVGGVNHVGIDLVGSPKDCKICAAADGVVKFAAYNGAQGYTVFIAHTHDSYSTRYCHLSRIGTKKGDKVKRGQVIGYQGNTGESFGAHLHFEFNKFKVWYKSLIPGTWQNTPLSKQAVLDPLYVLTNGAERSKNTTSNNIPSGDDYNVVEGEGGEGGGDGDYPTIDLNLSIGGSKLLEPSNDERKYGVTVHDTVQNLIRGLTASGIEGVNVPDAYVALEKYAKYLYYLINSGVSVCSVQTIAMPWIRPGFNVWLDPLMIDRIYYVNGVSHQGSSDGGVYTNINLNFGRDRRKFQKLEYVFGSLKPGDSDNVFISKTLVSPGDFSKNLISSASDFETIKATAEKHYSADSLNLEKALYHPYLQYLYNTINTESGTVDGTSKSPIIGKGLTAPTPPDIKKSEATTIVVGSSIKLTGKVYYDQKGSKPSATSYSKRSGKVTLIGNLSNAYPYHIDQLGWVSKGQLQLISSPSTTQPKSNATTSPAATQEFDGAAEIQKWLNTKYKSAPQVILERVAKTKSIVTKAEAYIKKYYVTEA